MMEGDWEGGETGRARAASRVRGESRTRSAPRPGQGGRRCCRPRAGRGPGLRAGACGGRRALTSRVTRGDEERAGCGRGRQPPRAEPSVLRRGWLAMWTGPPAHQGPGMLRVYCDGVGELWKGPEQAKGRVSSGPVWRMDRKPGGRGGSGAEVQGSCGQQRRGQEKGDGAQEGTACGGQGWRR